MTPTAEVQAQMMAARQNDIARAQRGALLAAMTASIAGPLVAVEYGMAMRKQLEEEAAIPGQTDGQFQVELQRPLQLAHNLAVMILKGPQQAPNGQKPPGA